MNFSTVNCYAAAQARTPQPSALPPHAAPGLTASVCQFSHTHVLPGLVKARRAGQITDRGKAPGTDRGKTPGT